MVMVMEPRRSMVTTTRVRQRRGKLWTIRQEVTLISRSLPLLLLALSVATSLLSGIVLGNHSELVECEFKTRLYSDGKELICLAVGSLFMPSVLAKSRIAEHYTILRNPFTMTVAGGSAAILLGSMVIAP
jgi:hypothetical protein